MAPSAPPPLGRTTGARYRVGAPRRKWLGLAAPFSGIIHIHFFFQGATSQATNFGHFPFRTVQCNAASGPVDNRGGVGAARGLEWSPGTPSIGGNCRRFFTRARGPPTSSFTPFWARQGPVSYFEPVWGAKFHDRGRAGGVARWTMVTAAVGSSSFCSRSARCAPATTHGLAVARLQQELHFLTNNEARNATGRATRRGSSMLSMPAALEAQAGDQSRRGALASLLTMTSLTPFRVRQEIGFSFWTDFKKIGDRALRAWMAQRDERCGSLCGTAIAGCRRRNASGSEPRRLPQQPRRSKKSSMTSACATLRAMRPTRSVSAMSTARILTSCIEPRVCGALLGPSSSIKSDRGTPPRLPKGCATLLPQFINAVGLAATRSSTPAGRAQRPVNDRTAPSAKATDAPGRAAPLAGDPIDSCRGNVRWRTISFMAGGAWLIGPPVWAVALARDAPGLPARELRFWLSPGCKSSGSAVSKVLLRPPPRRLDAPLAGGMGGYRIGSSGRAPWHAPEGNLRGASVGGRTMRLMVRPHHTAGPPLLAAATDLPLLLHRHLDAPLAGGMGGHRIGSSGRAPWHAPEGNLRGASVGGRTMRLMVRPHHTVRPPLLVASALLLSLLLLHGVGLAACRRSEPDVTPDELHKELRSIAQLLRLHHEKLLLLAKTAAAPGAFLASRDAIKVLGGREAKLLALLAAMPSTREVLEIRANVVQNFYADRDKLSSAIHDEVTKCRTLEAERRQPISHIGIAIICLSHLAGLVGVAWSAPSPPPSSPVLPSSSSYSPSYYYSSSSSSSPSSSASFSASTRANSPSSAALVAPTLAGTFAYTLSAPPSSPPPSPPGSSTSSCSLSSSPARRARRVRWPSGSPPPSPPLSPTGQDAASSAAPSPPTSAASSRSASPEASSAALFEGAAARARRQSAQTSRYTPAVPGRRGAYAVSIDVQQGRQVVARGEPPASYVASMAWTGAVAGKVFKRGEHGQGYYEDKSLPGGLVAALGDTTVGQPPCVALSRGAASISMRPCLHDCDCARCLPRRADERGKRFRAEAERGTPPLPQHRITLVGGKVNKTDAFEKTLAFAIRQLSGANKTSKPREILSAGLVNALLAGGLHEGALDDYESMSAVLRERQEANLVAATAAAARATTGAKGAATTPSDVETLGANGFASAEGRQQHGVPPVASISELAALKRKVAAAVRTLGERVEVNARASAVAAGGSEAGVAFDAEARERDVASAIASMVAAALAADEHARSVAAAHIGHLRTSQADIGLRVYCKLKLDAGQLPHEAWRLAAIRGLFFTASGDIEAFVEFVVAGAFWSPEDYPYVSRWSAGPLKSAAARQRGRPSLEQHRVHLGQMLTFNGLEAVTPPPRPLPGVATNELSSDAGAAAVVAYDGRAARASALQRVMMTYAHESAGFASACRPELWELQASLRSSCSPAQWLVAHYLHSIGWSDVVDGLTVSAALMRFKRVLPWQMIADALADLCETDVCASVQAPMTLGQIIGCTGKALRVKLQRESVRLPLKLEQLRSDGTLSAAMLDCWLRSAAKIIVDAKYEFVKVLAARVAAQKPILPRLEPGMCWMARQSKAYKTEVALSDAKFLLAQLRREAKIKAEGVVPTAATAPRVVIEVQRRRKCLVWNPGGVRVTDSRADRRLSDRERVRQAKRRASGAGAQADERDRELAAALEREDAEDGGGDVGRGSALRFKGCDALEAIIADVKSKDAHLLVLSETHLHGSAVEDVADYLGTRLGWQDLAKGRSGGAPEYSPCVVQAPAARGEWAGVLVAYDPNIFKKLDAQVVVPGRVLQVELRMIDDATSLTLFACYMPQANLAREVHHKAWGKLEEALLTVSGAYVIAGDLNAETKHRLLSKHKIDLGKSGVGKRPGEHYLHKIMHGAELPDFDRPERVGREEYTHLHVVSAATVDNEGKPVEAVTSKHVIDHVLQGGCDGRVGGGETFTVKVGSELNKQYHRALGFVIVTADIEEIVTSANRKPKLSKMPKATSKLKATSKAGGGKRDGVKAKKRLVAMANALPDRFEDGSGGLVDDAESGVDDSDLEEEPEGGGEGDVEEPVGWDAYKERAARASEMAMKDWVAGRESACAEAMQQLVSQGRPIDERSRALARDEAAARFAATNGTCVEHLMQACMLVAREVIAAPQAAKGRKQSAGEVLRRKLDKYLAIEKEVEDARIFDNEFGFCGKIPVRWRTRESALTPELRQLFLRDASPHAPGERKARELLLIRKCVEECVKEVDEHRLTNRVDYVNEQLTILAAKELGYARAAAEVIRAERRGLMSSKDKGPGGKLVALEDEATGQLLTGVDRDKAVAAKVRAGNTPNLVCLESAGHLMDRCQIERGERRGGSTARGSGAAFQVIEDAESRLGRQPRIARNRERVEACVRPPAGEFVVVGNARFPDEAHDGRVRYDGSRNGILGSPFRMGLDGRDENLRDLSCECYREWLETGGDAYAIAVARSFPIECVASGHGRISSADIEAEIGSLVEIVVELDKRLVLECGCAPKRCHLACIAEKCNELIRAKRAARSKQAADARDAGGVAAREQCGEAFECAGSDAADVGASDVASAGTGGEAFNTTDAVADVQSGVVTGVETAAAAPPHLLSGLCCLLPLDLEAIGGLRSARARC